jgi:hypothetical protein
VVYSLELGAFQPAESHPIISLNFRVQQFLEAQEIHFSLWRQKGRHGGQGETEKQLSLLHMSNPLKKEDKKGTFTAAVYAAQ